MKTNSFLLAACTLAFAQAPAFANDNQTVTTQDQAKSSDSDVELTRMIRKALVGRDDLSSNAKNVKIFASGGKVTLLGPVNSVEERNTVASIAQTQLTDKIRLVNELEIKK